MKWKDNINVVMMLVSCSDWLKMVVTGYKGFSVCCNLIFYYYDGSVKCIFFYTGLPECVNLFFFALMCNVMAIDKRS